MAPRDVVIVVYPDLQLLDLAGPLEVFDAAARIAEHRTGTRPYRIRTAALEPGPHHHASRESRTMTDTILVPLDGSELAEQALPHAAALARALAVPVTLARVPESVVVPVVSAGIWITHEVEAAEAREQAEAYLSALAESPVFEGITVGHAIPSVPVAANSDKH